MDIHDFKSVECSPYDIEAKDTVAYKGSVYYFKPNGAACYLYRSMEDYRDNLKAFSPMRKNVQRAYCIPLLTLINDWRKQCSQGTVERGANPQFSPCV
jgi:hypothetical protein